MGQSLENIGILKTMTTISSGHNQPFVLFIMRLKEIGALVCPLKDSPGLIATMLS